MYLRLCVLHKDPHTCQPLGVFIAAQHLQESGALTPQERLALQEVIRWFDRAMPAPPDSDRLDKRAIYWLKSDAEGLTRRLWELAQLLRSHGLMVEMVKTTKPGYVVYEDRFQVAAVPFRDSL